MANHPGRRRVAVERAATAIAHDHDHDYSALLRGVLVSFSKSGGPLFLTDADGLNGLYLRSLPAAERQIHNCHACRRFIEVYGALVFVEDDGALRSAMWRADVPDFYREAFDALARRVESGKIVSPFYSKEEVWGTPITGSWSHVAVTPPRHLVYRSLALTPGQAMAAARENYRVVGEALGAFKPAMIDQALRLLEAEAVSRSERFVAPLRWLRALHDRPKGRRGQNLMWRTVATAPEGYLHPRASVTGSLMEDIAAGLAFDEVKARWEAKLHPLRYLRPQVEPDAGNVRQAEALVERLGIARSLERRFARLDEVETLWLPRHGGAAGDKGVFGHLLPKDPGLDVRAPVMTWEKFIRTVLPAADRIEMSIPRSGNFEAFLTAAHSDAPLIFKWDNPVSTYVYYRGSTAGSWGLVSGSWCPVLALVARPNLWGGDPKPHLGEGVVLVLEGAEDLRTGQGNALFPETLRPELHAVRATIEAYSRRAEIGRVPGRLASGYGIGKQNAAVKLRVAGRGGWTVYVIDRWD